MVRGQIRHPALRALSQGPVAPTCLHIAATGLELRGHVGGNWPMDAEGVLHVADAGAGTSRPPASARELARSNEVLMPLAAVRLMSAY